MWELLGKITDLVLHIRKLAKWKRKTSKSIKLLNQQQQRSLEVIGAFAGHFEQRTNQLLDENQRLHTQVAELERRLAASASASLPARQPCQQTVMSVE